MQITSSSPYSALAPQTTQASSSTTSDISTTSTSADSTTSSGGVSTYDFTDMTPNQMQSAASALLAQGKITPAEAIKMTLIAIPVGTMVDGKFEPLTAAQRESYANTPVNYIQMFQSNMTFLQQNGMANDPKAGYADDKAILSAMESAQGGVSSVDITA